MGNIFSKLLIAVVFSLLLACPPSANGGMIKTNQPPAGTVNVNYSYSFLAGGNATFSVAGGSLPPGLTLSQNGLLSGLPTQTGVYGVTLRATDGTPPDDIETFYIGIAAIMPTPPKITSNPMPPALCGVPYSHTFTATGDPAPIFSFYSKLYQPVLQPQAYYYFILDPITGLFSGTSQWIGADTLALFAINGVSPLTAQEQADAQQLLSIKVNCAPYFFSKPNLPYGHTALPNAISPFQHNYYYKFEPKAYPSPTYMVSNGALPDGLSLNQATGEITGKPTKNGLFNFTLTISNGILPNYVENFTISIVDTPPVFQNAGSSILYGTPDEPIYLYTNSLIKTQLHGYALGQPKPVVVIANPNDLPPGLDKTPVYPSASIYLEGFPTQTGIFQPMMTASNGNAPDATQSFYLVVENGQPLFKSDPPTKVTQLGYYYNHEFILTGYPKPNITVTAGTLPAGLIFEDYNWLAFRGETRYRLSGVAAEMGDFPITLTASNGVLPNATQTFTITIAQAPAMNTAPTFISNPPPNGTKNVPYSHFFAVTGNPASAYTYSGNLPFGLSLSPSGHLSGTPTVAGNFQMTVTASNNVPPDATQTFTITIAQAPAMNTAPTFISNPPPNGTMNVPYSHFFAVTGNPASTYTYTGNLPFGLSLSPSGQLSGTPNQAGNFQMTVTASNGVPPDATQTFTITIAQAPAMNTAPTFTSNPPPNGTMNVFYSHFFAVSGNPASTYTYSGNLPPGLSLSSSGHLSGTPKEAGNFQMTVTASNGVPPDATQTFTLLILPTESNLNYQGMWWNSNESGWGMTVNQHGNMIFVAIYSYDPSGQPIWYVISNCPLFATSCTGDIYRVTGGTAPTLPWNGLNKAVIPVGKGTLTFTDASKGVFNYTIDELNGSKSITKMIFAAGTTSPPVDYTDLWWNANESGWGVSLTHQYGMIFASWYTYDNNGKPIWYVASSCPMVENGCTGTLYQVNGGTPFTSAWDGSKKVVSEIGMVNFIFTSPSTAIMSYFIGDILGARAITRQPF